MINTNNRSINTLKESLKLSSVYTCQNLEQAYRYTSISNNDPGFLSFIEMYEYIKARGINEETPLYAFFQVDDETWTADDDSYNNKTRLFPNKCG